jgi:hypothetical protein
MVPGYEILGELGRGGMGVVYRARHLGLDRVVALKVLLAEYDTEPDHLARFRREAEVIARLCHPHVVQVFAIGDHEGRPFLTLELAEGGSLARRLDANPMHPHEAAGLVETLARTMHEVHQRGIVHRDLKPANVLLAADGTPKITDFGLVKELDRPAGQTPSGAVLGTPAYMAPEQADGRPGDVTPRTDVYALGVILYECLTGRPPFQGDTALDVLMQVIADEPVPPGRLRPRVPWDLEAICLKCLQKKPARRFESALALAEELRPFSTGAAVRTPPWWRRRRLLGRAVVGLAALLSLVLAVVCLRPLLPVRSAATLPPGQAAESYPDKVDPQGAAGAATPEPPRVRERATGLPPREPAPSDLSPFSHAGPVLALAFGPDDKTLLGASADGTAHVWDRATGAGLRRFAAHPDGLAAAAFSPDGKVLAAALENQTVTVFEVASGKKIRRLRAESAVGALALAPDGKALATGGSEDAAQGPVVHWDLATGRSRRLGGQPGGVRCLVFCPDGTLLAAAGKQGVQVWDLNTAEGEGNAVYLHRDDIRAVAFSPDSKVLATAGEAGRISLSELATGRTVDTLEPQQDGGRVRTLQFSPGGTALASGDEASGVSLWSLATGKVWRDFAKESRPPVRCLSFSTDGRRLGFVTHDRVGQCELPDRGKLLPPANPLPLPAWEARWRQLASEDPARAYRACWSLVSAPGETVSLLATRLRPVAPAEPGRVTRLLADLEDPQFAAREQAARELARLGAAAEEGLWRTYRHPPSRTVYRRVEELLDLLEAQGRQPLRAIQVLERIGTPEALQVLETLARGARGARPTEEARAAVGRLRRLRPGAY